MLHPTNFQLAHRGCLSCFLLLRRCSLPHMRERQTLSPGLIFAKTAERMKTHLKIQGFRVQGLGSLKPRWTVLSATSNTISTFSHMEQLWQQMDRFHQAILVTAWKYQCVQQNGTWSSSSFSRDSHRLANCSLR